MSEFATHIANLEATTVGHLRTLIAEGKEARAFIGRPSCMYCRRFAEKLYRVQKETGAHIYFVLSEEASQLEELAAFRSEYGIPTVPGFLYIKDGKVEVKCDSSMSEEEIKAFGHL